MQNMSKVNTAEKSIFLFHVYLISCISKQKPSLKNVEWNVSRDIDTLKEDAILKRGTMCKGVTDTFDANYDGFGYAMELDRLLNR